MDCLAFCYFAGSLILFCGSSPPPPPEREAEQGAPSLLPGVVFVIDQPQTDAHSAPPFLLFNAVVKGS